MRTPSSLLMIFLLQLSFVACRQPGDPLGGLNTETPGDSRAPVPAKPDWVPSIAPVSLSDTNSRNVILKPGEIASYDNLQLVDIGQSPLYEGPMSISILGAGRGTGYWNPDVIIENEYWMYLAIQYETSSPIELDSNMFGTIHPLRLRMFTFEPTEENLKQTDRQWGVEWNYSPGLFGDSDPNDGFWAAMPVEEDLSNFSEIWIAVDKFDSISSSRSSVSVWHVPLFDASNPDGFSEMCEHPICVPSSIIVEPNSSGVITKDIEIVELCIGEEAVGIRFDEIQVIRPQSFYQADVFGKMFTRKDNIFSQYILAHGTSSPGEIYPNESGAFSVGYITSSGEYVMVNSSLGYFYGEVENKGTFLGADPIGRQLDTAHFAVLGGVNNQSVHIDSLFVMALPGGPIWRAVCPK